MSTSRVVLDPMERSRRSDLEGHPVAVEIEVPPKAESQGWGDMSFLRQ